MYDYVLHLQTKHRIEDMRRENQRRRWPLNFLDGLIAERAERPAKPQTSTQSPSSRT